MPVFIVFLCRKRFFNTTYFGKKPFVSLCKNFSKKFSENLLTIYYSYDIFIKRSSREHAGVAQLVEQLICNQQVGGSNPSTSSKFHMGEFPSGQRGQTVNLLSTTSVVRIHLLPPKNRQAKACLFFYPLRKQWHIIKGDLSPLYLISPSGLYIITR